MEQGRTHNGEGEGGIFSLTEFSVVLVASPGDPSILNPDFLHHNEIVGTEWQVQEPRISTPAFSQVTYSGGLTVTADPERIIFAQSGNGMLIDEIACPDVAQRYIRAVPHIYRAVGINPKGLRRSVGPAAYRVTDALVGKGAWMSFKDATPDIQLKAVYRYAKRTVTVDIMGTESRSDSGGGTSDLLFQANIHRDITETSQQARIDRLLSVIGSWKEDLSDFSTIVAKFGPGA